MFMVSAAYPYNDLPVIGSPYQGGYYAGLISHTADGNATHALIVAARSSGASGTGYTLTTNYRWKTTESSTPGTSSLFDGRANTDAMIAGGITNHPAGQFCVNLSLGGYSDWYLPALAEMGIAYINLKPTTQSNTTSTGTNNYSIPKRLSTYTTSSPAQTSVLDFRNTGTEPFVATTTADPHWTSTEISAAGAYPLEFATGGVPTGIGPKSSFWKVRAFRRIAL
jgi:hypothetical protein